MGAKRLAFDAIGALSHAVSPDALARVEKCMHFKTLFAKYAIDLIFDVGANGGQFATTMRDYGFAGDILSFEPVAAEFARLTAAATGDRRWAPMHCALGEREGEQTINIMADSVFSSFNAPSEAMTSAFAKENKVVATEVVTVKRLDRIIADQKLASRLPHALLKCDTQGFDLHVLEGCGEDLAKVRLLQIETSISKLYDNAPSMIHMLNYLDARGFAPVAFFPVNRLGDGSVVEFDYLGVNRRLT
ncbi:MAG TPA: FkbM family methyltransferase [Methylovirgula sp.]|jgi:FkbM family methyltransferase